MSNSGPYRDGPNQIKYEAQQISLTFVKDTPESAVLSWNIPTPIFGCDPDSRAYNGIVLTVSPTPVTQADKPLNNTWYTGDPSASAQLNAGDRIGNAFVVAALYDDDITTSVNISDIESHQAYYFSAYAVSAQCIYDNAGAHAYSLPLGREGEFSDFPGYQEVRVLGMPNKRVNIRSYKEQPVGSMLGQSSTSLNPASTYKVTVCSDLLGDGIPLDVTGFNIETWDGLVSELNRQIALSMNPILASAAPNTGSLYLNAPGKSLFKWTGTNYQSQPLITTTTNPSSPTAGDWWFNTSTNQLSRYDGTAWIERPFVEYTKPYSYIVAGDYWVNPIAGFAAEWEGSTWCKRGYFTGMVDPASSPTLPGGTFWYNTDTGYTSEWDPIGKCWSTVGVMYSNEDPSTLLPGQLWYNDSENVLYRLTASYTWAMVPARIHEIAAKTPADGDFWINPKTDEVKQYNFATQEWQIVDCIHWGSNPLERKSCDKWWDADNDKLYIWDFLSGDWVEAVSFIQSAIDPSIAPVLEQETIWNAPQGMFKWDGMQWVPQVAIVLPHDPRVPVDNEITKVGLAFFERAGSTWNTLSVLTTEFASTVAVGTYWYNPTTLSLDLMTATGWTPSSYVVHPQVPAVGSQYFNVVTQTLMEWTGSGYAPAVLPAHFLINELNNFMFVSKTIGSKSYAKIALDQLFKDTIKPQIVGFESVIGTDGIPSQPTYKTQGIGTDGSVDERREYANYVLSQLGYPKVQVELSKRQVDEAIDDALELLRQRTSAVYTRSYMVLDFKPEQQIYELSNKAQGLDRIVRVMKVHRTKYGRIGAYSYEDTFGSAMVQQLYSAGSFDLLSYHLLASYNQLVNTIFANDITFSWNEYNRTLYIQQAVKNKERVLVEVELEKTEQELLVDRNLRSWIKKYVLGKSMLTLARIRGKFGSLPGAGGGISLNGNDLATEGATMIEECIMDIENQIISGLDQYGSSSLIVMG